MTTNVERNINMKYFGTLDVGTWEGLTGCRLKALL